MSNPIAILSAMRTPMGGMMGSLSSLSASDLGGVAISSAISKSGLNASDIDEVLMTKDVFVSFYHLYVFYVFVNA